MTEDGAGGAVRPDHGHHDFDQRALAGAVGPEQAEDLAGTTCSETPRNACTFRRPCPYVLCTSFKSSAHSESAMLLLARL